MKTQTSKGNVKRRSVEEIAKRESNFELKRKTICLVEGHEEDSHLEGDIQYCKRCDTFYSVSEPKLVDYEKKRRIVYTI